MSNPFKLFNESVTNHQRLVDILVDVRNKEGISEISQPEIASRTNHSQTWVGQAIKRLNIEDLCVEMLGSGKYVVYYSDIAAQGVFNKIGKLLVYSFLNIENLKEMLSKQDKQIAFDENITLKTVQMFKTYLRTAVRNIERNEV